ncbi:MAG: Fe-S cluster assembly ATPase SufC [Candidatus Micrarchaeota archaeon]
MLLEIKNLTVNIGDAEKIIDCVSLSIKKGEIHVIMGPNGSGKSTLANAIMGNPIFSVDGKILFEGKEITKLVPEERAALGIFLAFQNPPEIEGVTFGSFIRAAKSAVNDTGTASGKTRTNNGMDIGAMVKLQEDAKKIAKEVGLGEDTVKREINVGFSGGEKKRAELLQMRVLEPKLAILDEMDSGLDADGLRMMAEEIKKMANASSGEKRAFIIITHNAKILEYVKPHHVHIMVDGKLIKSGGPEIAQEIEKSGYKKYSK